MSARYTYLFGSSMAALMDQVNNFCQKYPEYRLLQILVVSHNPMPNIFAIMTTDPLSEPGTLL